MINRILPIILVSLSFPAWAEDAVKIGNFPRQQGMLPANQIVLWNSSSNKLKFWIALESKIWKPFTIDPDHRALIYRSSMHMAISTSLGADDALANAKPSVGPNKVGAETLVNGRYFYTGIKGGSKVQLCWSATQERWRTQGSGETYCE